jgi:hypothetical protein
MKIDQALEALTKEARSTQGKAALGHLTEALELSSDVIKSELTTEELFVEVIKRNRGCLLVILTDEPGTTGGDHIQTYHYGGLALALGLAEAGRISLHQSLGSLEETEE